MVSAPTLNRLTVQQSVERYLRMVRRAVAGHSLAATTAANYERDLAEFVELAEKYHDVGVILDDLTAEDVDNIVIEYGSKPDGRHRPKPGKVIKTRGPGAQARFRQSVARLFSEAVLEGWVEASPIPRTRVRPRTSDLKDAARKALPESSAAALLDAEDAEAALLLTWRGLRMKPRDIQLMAERTKQTTGVVKSLMEWVSAGTMPGRTLPKSPECSSLALIEPQPATQP